MLSLGQVARVQGVCDVVAALCASHCGAAFTGAEGAGQLLKALLRLRGALDPLSAEHSPLPCSFGRAAERACVSMLLSEGLREDAVEEASGWVTEGALAVLGWVFPVSGWVTEGALAGCCAPHMHCYITRSVG